MKIIDLSNIQTKPKNAKIINSFAEDIDNGLSLKNKAISSKYFYDDSGDPYLPWHLCSLEESLNWDEGCMWFTEEVQDT